jgi:RimJ/RimL family protein N-acetyltransferase
VSRARARIARAEDVKALRRFRCDRGEQRYARDVQQLVRGQVATRVRHADAAYEVILVEVDEAVAAICVLATELDAETCDLIVVAIANDYQGEQLDTDLGSMPLARVAIEILLARARELGARRALGIVAPTNRRSVNMLERAGFTRSATFDNDYDVCAVTLA